MSYDLIARNKKISSIGIGAFSWPIMLQDTGMGYVLGYGANVEPASYVYQGGNNGSPSSNDGYKVTSFEAKAMAKVARGYISVKRFINKQYEDMDEKKREFYKSSLYHGENGIVKKMFEQPVSEEFLQKLDVFAEFAEQSNGFKIR